jgi:hypothetical protein
MPGPLTSTSSRRRTAVLAGAALALAGLVALDPGPGHAAPLSPCVSADNSPPVVQDVTFTPSAVEVSHASAYLTAADGTVQMPVRFERHAGDTWSTELTLPRNAPAGEWHLAGVTVSDAAGNTDEDYFSSSGDRPPFDETLAVASSPTPDREDPVATRVAIRDHRVDTTRGPADVRVEVWATDAGAGVATVAVDAVRGRHLVRTELSDQGDGSFAGDLRIPRWAGTGTWELQWLGVHDGLGQDRHYRHDRLRALGDHTFQVTSRTDETAPAPRHGTWRGSVTLTPCTRLLRDRIRTSVAVRDAAGNRLRTPVRRIPVRHPDHRAPEFGVTTASVPPGGPVTIAFDEAVNGVSDTSATVQQWDGADGRYGEPLAGSWSCSGRDHQPVSCDAGHVRTASWTPVWPLGSPTHALVVLNPAGTLELTDLHGNPFVRDGEVVRVEQIGHVPADGGA